jgi:hypothetical protein
MKNFYIATFVAWLVWILFLDNNNMRVVVSNRMKMKDLEKEKADSARKDRTSEKGA